MPLTLSPRLSDAVAAQGGLGAEGGALEFPESASSWPRIADFPGSNIRTTRLRAGWGTIPYGATWIVKAWDMIMEETARKAWTECGYLTEDELAVTTEKLLFYTQRRR